MIRSTLLVAAGVLAATCFACVLPPPPNPPPPAPMVGAVMAPAVLPALPYTAKLQTPACGSAAEPFPASRIVDLANAPFFDPAAYSACGMAGDGRDCRPQRPLLGGQSQYATSIANAINQAAATALKNHLCSLNYIFVDNSIDSADQNAGAWGMREVEIDPNTGKWNILGTHIGLRAGLLSGFLGVLQGPPGPFASYETAVVQYLLNPPVSAPPPPAPQPTPLPLDAKRWVDSVSYTQGVADQGAPNPPTTAILGILAHEMGHVLWVSKLRSSDPAAPDRVCNKPGFKKHFHSHAWADSGHKFGFHRFGQIDYAHRPILGGNIVAIRGYLQNNDLEDARNYLADLYESGKWASLFATVSVDEDFVETYMLHQLNAGLIPLTSFLLRIPAAVEGETPIIIDAMQAFSDSTSGLARKALWIDNCL
jgi:hypothetical protein